MITYPLDNIDYAAEDAELYFSTRHSGVYDGDDDFEVTVSGIDNDVTVGTGIAWIHNTNFSGKVVALKVPKTLTLSLPNSVYDRIDAIVIQFDANENATDIIVKEGVASSVPVAPNVVRTASLYELHIFHIRRRAGAATIGVNDVIDQRKNQDYCGVMFDPVSSIDETLSKRGFAADAASVGVALENAGGIKMELLWENASPTSAFASQIVEIDYAEYELLLVAVSGGSQIIAPKIGASARFSFFNIWGTGTASAEVFHRATVVEETGIRFGVGYFAAASTMSFTTDNNRLIPLAIYGIKGVATE